MKMQIIILVALSLFSTALLAQESRYEIKSAVIKKDVIAMGQKMEGVYYIDDFGKKESAEMTMKMLGTTEEKHFRTIIEQTSVVNIDLDMKTANRVNLPVERINYLQLTPEIREKYKIEEIGKEEVAGKECQKYSMEIDQMGQTIQMVAWVWKGIPLKTETASNGMVVSIETAIEVIEEITGFEDKLNLPAGIIMQ